MSQTTTNQPVAADVQTAVEEYIANAGVTDWARFGRAIELVATGNTNHLKKYDTTYYGCSCADRTYRKVVCKHMSAVMLTRYTEAIEAKNYPTIEASTAWEDAANGYI